MARISFDAALRSVSGVFSLAAAANAAVMPGTISKGTPALAQRSDLFPRAPEDQRIARLQPKHRSALPGGVQHQDMNLSLRNPRLSAAFAHRNDLGSGVSQRKHLIRNQIVRENHIRGLQKPQSAQRQQTRIPGPAPTR